MQRILFFIMWIAALPAAAQMPAILTAEEARADLDSLYQALKDNHPHIYAWFSRAGAERAFTDTRNEIRGPLSITAFRKQTAAFLALFRDGHTYMDISLAAPDLKEYDSSGGRFFPLPVRIHKDRIFAADTSEAGIAPGDEILAVNGVRSFALVRELKKLMSADGEENSVMSVQRLFPYMLWLNGWRESSFQLEIERAGKVQQVNVAGADRRKMLSQIFNTARPMRQLHVYPEQSLAIVEINSYVQVERAQKFIDSCFRIIRELGIKNLALDLRTNGGGNSFIGDYFLAHLTRNPYSIVKSKSWRIGPLVQAIPQDHWMYAALRNPSFTQKGEWLESPPFGPQQPPAISDSSLVADVRFFLLTSARTYSSAHMTAMAVKCSGLGKIIGQATGERMDFTGEILEYRLPHSRLVAIIPSATYKAACGSSSQVGVQPDHHIPFSLQDLKAGRDTEVEWLKQYLKGR